jgi:glycosyltransferase involved in cell wall biosynthesis
MARLAVVPGNTIDDLVDKGLAARLAGYYNPQGFFEKVFVLSPFENVRRETFGMAVVPTKDVELPSRIRENSIDIVRAYGGNSPSEMAVFHRVAGVPVIVSIHDKRPEMLRRAIRFADAVFVVSEELRSLVLSLGVKPERIFVVPNGVDFSLMKPLSPEALGDLPERFSFKRKLLHVGRRSPEKNIEAIIRVLARLGPDYGFISVGQRETAPYLALARKAGVADRCAFLPGVAQPDLVKFYSWADCVCHPSRSEAMCNVLVEALACGAAVVATRTAAIGLGAGPDRAMLLFEDPDDDAALERAIRLACEDAGLRRALKDDARRSVDHLSLERTQAHEAACYRRVLDMNARGNFRRGPLGMVALCVQDFRRRLCRKLGIK